MQTKTQSALEAGMNIVIGMVIAFIAQLIVFPAVGVRASIPQNIMITVCFTFVSFIRIYIIRRFWNFIEMKGQPETKKRKEG